MMRNEDRNKLHESSQDSEQSLRIVYFVDYYSIT